MFEWILWIETRLQNTVCSGKLREQLFGLFVIHVVCPKIFDKLTHLSALLHQAVFEFLQSFFGLAGVDDKDLEIITAKSTIIE